jgi:hypothetical protein
MAVMSALRVGRSIPQEGSWYSILLMAESTNGKERCDDRTNVYVTMIMMFMFMI